MKSSVNRNVIYIFNLTSDLNSPVLAAGMEWTKAFARQARFVHVFSTHLGVVPTIQNVDFHEIGGGSFRSRLLGILRLFAALISILPNAKKAIVFHHMSPRTALLIGPFLRLLKIPQGLWYSHSVASFELQIARYFVNTIFTSSESAIPIQSEKTRFVGHGISTELFQITTSKNRKKMSISSVGRIARIKKLELILNEISDLQNNIQNQIDLEFVGGIQDSEYKENLEQIAEKHSLQLQFLDPIPYNKLSDYYNNRSIYFTGTPKSIDKATLEAAFCGCFVVSENPDALRLTGMENLYGPLAKNGPPKIKDQIRKIYELDFETEGKIRKLISEYARSQNDVNATAEEIIRQLRIHYE